MTPVTQDPVGLASGIQALYNFALKAGQEKEVWVALVALFEDLFQKKVELRERGIFNSIVKTPEGNKFLTELIEPHLIYEFFLRRLREKLPVYSGYAVKYLVAANSVRAIEDIASAILECEIEKNNIVAQQLVKEWLTHVDRRVNDRLFDLFEPMIPLPEDVRADMKMVKNLLHSSQDPLIKAQLSEALAKMQSEVNKKISRDKLYQRDPKEKAAAIERVREGMSRLFGAKNFGDNAAKRLSQKMHPQQLHPSSLNKIPLHVL